VLVGENEEDGQGLAHALFVAGTDAGIKRGFR
jgi:hypothetical protein